MEYKQIYESLGLDGKVVTVVGHKNPDSDTVCSAIALANFLNAIGVKAEAAVSGKINNETVFILKSFGVQVPNVLENASGKTVAIVDHSTFGQAIQGMEEANIIEILDHHALGNMVTGAPLVIKALPVGSSATIVYFEYVNNNITLTKEIAGLLVSALLSDTVNLTSATTTSIDKEVAAKLLPIAGITDVASYFDKMSEAAASYDGLSDEEIFNADFKEFEMGSKKVGITQVNMLATTSEELTKRMLDVLPKMYEKKGIDMLFVMATNRDTQRTQMLCFGNGAKEACEASFIVENGNYFINSIASRKKEVVPKLMAVIK